MQVIDTTIPVITLEGANPLTVDCSDSYTDPGASVEDACDTNLAEVIINSANVVPDVAGTYTVSFSATDEAGNTATATRTVIVDGPNCVVKAKAKAALKKVKAKVKRQSAKTSMAMLSSTIPSSACFKTVAVGCPLLTLAEPAHVTSPWLPGLAMLQVRM